MAKIDEKLVNEIIMLAQANEIIALTINERQEIGNEKVEIAIPNYDGMAGQELKDIVKKGIKNAEDWMPKKENIKSEINENISQKTPQKPRKKFVSPKIQLLNAIENKITDFSERGLIKFAKNLEKAKVYNKGIGNVISNSAVSTIEGNNGQKVERKSVKKVVLTGLKGRAEQMKIATMTSDKVYSNLENNSKTVNQILKNQDEMER